MDVRLRTAKRRERVVLLHSSASSARQWDALAAALSGRYRVHAIDLHGHGRGPAWHGRTALTLAAEAALAAPLLAAGPVHLVGHSYGGAVALEIASLHAEHVRSIAVWEPVLFRTLFDEDAEGAAAGDVRAIVDAIRACLGAGRAAEAARRFVDFWSGGGQFDRLSAVRQGLIAAQMPTVLLQFEALFRQSPSLAALQRLEMPRLFLTGSNTVRATRRIGELLRRGVGAGLHQTLPGAGHLGPISHAAAFNARVAAFLAAPELRPDPMTRAAAGPRSRIAASAPSAHRSMRSELVD